MIVWYDKGGVIPACVTLVRNASGAPIIVQTAEQIRQGRDYIERTYRRDEEEDVD